MSQPKITLRPPPNVDFVQGYPGIPPGAPDRPQAAVKGAIEVRVGPAGVKAKWVRIELRKVETLPGGGVANTYFDFVGQSPINLWQASEEYAVLETQDFPFYIRIPESIPPSIALEKGAGIKYELIATLCIKGKKGFLRRDKHIIVSSSAPIVVDKHELHSTWPVYQQPETRDVSVEGVTLSVHRTNTCYGPGDRIAVMATVKSDNLNTVILRGFEFSLRESTVFRAGANSTGKKGQPIVKTGNISEQKVPVNATLYGGMQHKAELSVTVPSHHTSTTLNTARHIDITYVLTVRALLGTSKPVAVDLPVIVSNWPRSVSVEAVRRIGLAPSVSSHVNVIPAASAAIGRPIVEPVTFTSNSAAKPVNHPYMNPAPPATTETSSDGGNFNTAPVGGAGYGRNNVDEFGARPRGQSIDQRTNPQIQTIGGSQTGGWDSNNTGARPRSSGGRSAAPAANRLTVTNYHNDMPEEVRAAQLAARSHARNTSIGSGRPNTASTTHRTGFMTAEEEKKVLYERAKAKVEEVQGVVRSKSPPLEVHSPKPIRDNGPIQLNGSSGSSSKPSGSAWPSAEEEKARLFASAQDAVRKAQGGASPVHTRNGSVSGQASASSGAALYSQAMASVGRNASAGQSTAAPAQSPGPSAKSYPSAEEEKAALRRYHEAKAAVDRNQNAAFGAVPDSPPAAPYPPSNPIPYDALYPSSPPAVRAGLSPPPAPRDSPPALKSSPQAPSQPSYLSEKEKLRRAYEERDAAAMASQNQANQVVSPAISAVQAPAYYPPPPPMTPQPQQNGSSALSEKEKLRRAYEAQDAAAAAAAAAAVPNSPAPQTPPRSATGGGRGLPVPRSQPTPPVGGSSSRPLTAAEEKARLRAMYDADERGPPPTPYSPPPTAPNGVNGGAYTNGSVNGHADLQRQLSQRSNYADIPPPPPLMPRPPKEYIEETRMEDHHLSAQIQAIEEQEENGISTVLDRAGSYPSSPPPPERQMSQGMPFAVPPPPPLPPKLGVTDP